jgi:UDP-glucose 4-epimerase
MDHSPPIAGSAEAFAAYRGLRCLVTGGAGFIGSNLTRRLAELGAVVTVIDDFSTGRRDHLPAASAVRVVAGDLRSLPELRDLVSEVDVVFHLAAQVGNVKSIAWPETDASVNVVGTVRLLDACRQRPLRGFVYSSSSAIFGEAERLPIDEDHPQRPASFYALSKRTGERYALLARTLWGVPAVCLRYFNVYGLPMEDNEYTGVISIFLQRLQRGEPLTVYGDGEAVRDFVFVDDVVQANLRAGLSPEGGSAVFNIGTGQAVSIRQLAAAVSEVTGVPLRLQLAPARAGEVARSVADIGRAKRELGYAPAWQLQRGLQTLWAALVAAPPA